MERIEDNHSETKTQIKMKKSFLILTVLFLSTICTFGQNREEFHLPDHEQVEDMIGYTHAVKIGSTLYISGTVDGRGEDMKSQMTKIYQSVDKTLQNYGVTSSAIVKENIYTTDLESFKEQIPLRKGFYKEGIYPTSTWVQVERLFIPQLLVEMEFMAIVE